MWIGICDALALVRWHGLSFLQDFSARDFAWMLVGALLAAALFWARSRQRRRWF
jgi:hypothetical protein